MILTLVLNFLKSEVPIPSKWPPRGFKLPRKSNFILKSGTLQGWGAGSILIRLLPKIGRLLPAPAPAPSTRRGRVRGKRKKNQTF